MLKPHSWLLLLLLFCCNSLLAQNNELDSINGMLQQPGNDTNTVNLYYKAGSAVIYQDPMASLVYFKKGVELSAKLNFIPGLERCNNACYFAFSINGKYDSALYYINIAIPYAIQVGNVKRLTLVYLNRADVHSNLQNYPAALKDCDTSIYYAEQLQGNSDALGRINGIISGIYIDQAKYPEAELFLDRALGFFYKTTNRRMVAQMMSDKADLYNKLEQPAKALPLLTEAVRIGDSLRDSENLSAYYLSLSESYAKLKRYEEGKKAARECIRICEETQNIIQTANAWICLYEIAEREKDVKASITYALNAYTIVAEYKDTVRQRNAAANLSSAYFADNDPANAYKYLKISAALSDSLVKKKYDQETAKLQSTFEIKAKDNEIQLLNKNKELQSQRLQKQFFMTLGAAAIALLAIGSIWLLMNRNKLRQRMKELELRNRIAADLHDEVGSSLSSIHMLSQMASQKTNEAGHQDILSRMSANAKETMDKMGDIVWMIKPGETEAGSLKQRMERFAYEVGTSKNMEIVARLDELEKVKLSMEQRKNIYLIFKEAVNNAAKYSGSRKIDIDSSIHNKELQLIIKDEGSGFDHHKTKKGNGLGNMMNRAEELGGRLEIGSLPDEGTTITLTMPV
jgi:two-component system sensor histidine kinase UhpB